MILLFLEQTALLGALSAIVFAIFWPHIRPVVEPLVHKYVISQFGHLEQDPNIDGKRIFMHPKLTQKSNKNPGQLDIFPAGGHLHEPALGRNALPPATAATDRSSILLSLFTSCLVALILYMLMRMLSSKFSQHSQDKYLTNQDYKKKRRLMTESNLNNDRKRPGKINRDERARQLIMLHGGKNVSSAIKFLVDELEKQKQLLRASYAESKEKTLSTDQVCAYCKVKNSNYTTNDTAIEPSDDKLVDRKQTDQSKVSEPVEFEERIE